MDRTATAYACGTAGIQIGRAIREAIHGMPPAERATPTASPLKPTVRELARHVDHVGDTIGISHLERLSSELGCRIHAIVDPHTGAIESVGSAARAEVIFAYMDAVDGTIKVGGLGNDMPAGKFRVANDGGWAAAIAFTAPTTAALGDLRLSDFVAAAIVDGNPTRYRAYPQELLTVPIAGGLATYDVTAVTAWQAGPRQFSRVFTSTNTNLSQCMAYLDSFQAYDRETRRDGDEALAVELYRLLINRHEGGAFDVLRQYANLNALQRVMLGWRDGPVWVEPQGAAFVAVNENLFNLVPAMAIIAGAGGITVDFDNQPLGARRLTEGRTSIVHAANEHIRDHLSALVERARRRADAGTV